MTVADKLTREARDYRTRAIAAQDQGDQESAVAFKIVAVVLGEISAKLDQELEAA